MVNLSQMNQKPKVVVIGGGSGAFVTLSGLKKYPLDISVIVSMMDDGGSNRVIRDEFGLLPTSDLRQCMVALASSGADETLRKLFTYRYSSGTGITGMTFGNLFMAALTDIYNGDQEKAIMETCRMLNVNGHIIPVTYDRTNLIAKYDNGREILGEHNIDEPTAEQGKHKLTKIYVLPKVKVYREAKIAVKEADLIVFSPGDLYTSVLCNLVIGDFAKVVKKSKAKKLFVINLMTKFGQTNNFKASDYVETLEKYLGKNTLDYVLLNDSPEYPKRILNKYKQENSILVKDNLSTLKDRKFKVIKKDVISNQIYKPHQNDKLLRSLIRHDSDKLASAIYELVK
jgi:uncharacterized cofD-like protein